MKVTIKENKPKFEPIEISIVIESQKEVDKIISEYDSMTHEIEYDPDSIMEDICYEIGRVVENHTNQKT